MYGYKKHLQLFPVCGNITAGVALSCSNQLIGGANDRLILINYDEIASYTRNVSNAQIIEAITMVATKKGYAFEGKQQSVEPKQSLNKKRYATAYDHEITFKVFDSTPAVKEQLEKLVQGKVVAIVENNYKGATGNAAFELYGADAGLYVETLERNVGDAEVLGAFNIVLKSGEFAKEGNLPASIFITDYTTTKALVDALL